MSYRFRLVYSGLLSMAILTMGYLSDIRPLLSQNKHLVIKQKFLNEKLHIIKLSTLREKKISPSEKTKPDLLTLIQEAGLQIKAIRLENGNILDVNLSGHFHALILFLNRLKENELKSFSITLDKNNLVIHFRIVMPLRFIQHHLVEYMDTKKIKKTDFLMKVSSPFCLPRLIVH